MEHEYLPNFTTITTPINIGGGSCIDNMFAKTNFKCKAHKIIQKITDHYTLLLHIDLNSLDKIDNKKKSFSINYKKLINLCSKEDFNLLVNSNIDDSLDQFINKVQELIKLSLNKTKVNKKDKKKSRVHKEWITPALIKSCNTKSNLYKIWQNNPHNIALKENYMKFSNKLHNLIKYTKLKFEKNKINSFKNDPKKVWQYVKDKLGTSTRKTTTVTSLKINDIVIKDPKEISNHFNNFFNDIGSKLVENLNPPLVTFSQKQIKKN